MALIDDVDGRIEEGTDELVALCRSLVRLDTTSVDLSPGSDHTENDESACQAVIAGRLRSLGAEVDQWEPDVDTLRCHPMMPPWHHFRGRPITVGVLRGRGGGRSLVVNGHIDVVDAGDPANWASPPFAAEIRERRLYGRGAVDMKGGIAAAIFALDVLGRAGIHLAGDVIFEAVTDEETCAMGTVAAIERGYRGDAGLVPEPTRMNLWIATRGLLHGTLGVPGRSAHAEVNQPHWRDGGGVNAIRKATYLLGALAGLEAQWAGRQEKQHPLLGTPGIHPTIIRGGAFISNVPERCEVAINATYLPGEADADGYGSGPRGEIERVALEAAAADDWLGGHPPSWSWYTDYPPSEIDPGHAIVATAREAAAELGIDSCAEGIDTTYDGALLTRFAGTPSPAFGAGDLARAHAPDEWVGIDELVTCSRAYARVMIRWCGLAGAGA